MDWLRARIHRFLRWTERYTKTDMVYATKGGFWLTLERVFSILFGFAMSVAFANLMEPEKYGIYKYILSMMGIIGAFSLGGLTTAVNQAVSRGFEGALRAGFAASLRWSVGSIVIAGILSLYYFLQGNHMLGSAFLIAGSLSPLIAASSLYDNFIAGKKMFAIKAAYGIVRIGFPTVAVIATLLASKEPLILLGVYFISTAFATHLCYRDVIRRFTPHTKTDDATLGFSKHLSAMNIIDTFSAQFDRVFAFSHLGGTALAIYSFAELIPDQFRGLGNIAGTLALPKMTASPLSELKKTLPRKVGILFLFSLLGAGFYVLIAPSFFAVFFPQYIEAVTYTQVYALTMLGLPGILFSRALIAHARHKELYILKITSAVFRVVSIAILVLLYGLWGLILAGPLYYAFSGLALSILFFAAKEKQQS